MRSLHFRCVTITSDGSKALSGSYDESLRVWDLNSSAYLKQDRSRGHLECVTDIAVTRDGSRCVSASRDGSLKIWNCETAEECFTLRGIVRFVHLRQLFDSTVTKLHTPVRLLQTSKSSMTSCLITMFWLSVWLTLANDPPPPPPLYIVQISICI